MPEQEGQIGEEILRMPAQEQAESQADNKTANQKSISRNSSKSLFRQLLAGNNRSLDRLGTIGIVCKIFAQPCGQMPDADQKQGDDDRTACNTKHLPQRWLDHSYKERRQK